MMVTYKRGSDGYNARAQNRNYNRTGRRPFAGIDGEGGTRDGRHHYFYLRAGSADLFNDDGSPLSTTQCLSFIADLDPLYNYVGFFFDYDVTMVLRDLSIERIERLLKPKSFIGKDGKPRTLPCDWREFQITYRPGKEFKVRRRLADGYSKWVAINDVGSFFQCSFVRALEEWLGEYDKGSEEYVIKDERTRAIVDKIAEGKLQRNEFTGLTEYIREYCALEVQELAKLMERFRDNCSAVGLKPTRWQGPGYLVSAAMKRNNFPKNTEYKELVPDEVWQLAQDAYYGGRFEAPIIGAIERPVYQYDINSAYAGVYRHLPCLIHGQWIQQPTDLREYPLITIMHGEFMHRPRQHVCALPVRDKNGGIYFPHLGQGAYWFFEINAAKGNMDFRADKVWSYVRQCGCEPFEWVQAIYDERMRVGKKTGMGGILKLTLASTYGKLCQSIGMAPYSNPVWASLITAFVRAQLYSAAIGVDNGRDVVMLATDGLFTLNERPGLLVSKEIGEWERDVHDSMFVIQSGLYFLPGKKPKSRGVPGPKVEKQRQAIIDAWYAFLPQLWYARKPYKLEPAYAPVYVDQFISLTQAYAWGDMTRAGQWHNGHERKLTFDWRAKRATRGRANLCGRYLITVPHRGSRKDPNFPYSKSIGGIVNGESTVRKDIDDGQPDWNRFTL